MAVNHFRSRTGKMVAVGVVVLIGRTPLQSFWTTGVRSSTTAATVRRQAMHTNRITGRYFRGIFTR
jgi:hypothetical protein